MIFLGSSGHCFLVVLAKTSVMTRGNPMILRGRPAEVTWCRRGRCPHTVRLASFHAFYDYAPLRHPEHADTIRQVLRVPAKRHHRTALTYLTAPEVTA